MVILMSGFVMSGFEMSGREMADPKAFPGPRSRRHHQTHPEMRIFS
jgi:hypothetical protein